MAVSQVNPDGTVEEWDLDAGTYSMRRNGTVVSRQLTAAEVEWLSGDAGRRPGVVDPERLEELRQQARSALVVDRVFLDRPTPAFPMGAGAQQVVVAQVAALTRQVSAIIRLLVGREFAQPDVVSWVCGTGTPTSTDGRLFLFDCSAASGSPYGGQTVYVDRWVTSTSGAGGYEVALEVRDGATVHVLPQVVAGYQTMTETDFATGHDQWYFDSATLPAGTVLDDVRFSITLSGTLAVVWQSVCVGFTVGG